MKRSGRHPPQHNEGGPAQTLQPLWESEEPSARATVAGKTDSVGCNSCNRMVEAGCVKLTLIGRHLDFPCAGIESI